MYEDWTNENLKRHLDMLYSFGYKMEKEFFEKKELKEKSKSNFEENNYVDLKVDIDKPIKAYKGFFKRSYLKDLFNDCHFTYFEVIDFRKKGLFKYKAITLSFKDYRGYEQTKEIRGKLAEDYSRHGMYYYDTPNIKKETIIAYTYQGKFALVYDYTLKNHDKIG